VWELRAEGTLRPVDVEAHESVAGEYRPPVLTKETPSWLPQRIISLPVQTCGG
jgi:hypothetical protein